MQLLRFELYKIFKQRSMWFAFLLIAGMSYLSLGTDFDPGLEKELYRKWEGPITEEKLERARTEQEALLEKWQQRGDDQTESWTDREEIQRSIYRKLQLAQQAETNIALRLQALEREERISAELERGMLERIRISDMTFHSGAALIVNFVEFGAYLFMGVMLLIGLSPIYSREYSTGADNYLFSTKRGRRTAAWAKIGAASIYTALMLLAWEMLNLTVNLLRFGSGGWETSIQLITLHAEAPYIDSPYAFTILEYHLIQLGVHFAGAVGFALLIVLVSSLSRNSMAVFFTCGFIFMAPVWIRSLEAVASFSYTSVMRVQFLFDDFQALNVFGIPVLYPVFAVLAMIALSAISIGLLFQVIKRKEVVQ